MPRNLKYMNYEDNPRSIKYYVKRYLLSKQEKFSGKTVIDFPAGNGVTTEILRKIGAIPKPMDLFPEYFKLENLECLRANINESLPIENSSVDALICQEGIEHFSDQHKAIREFNRVLKTGGTLLITTPNYSNLQSKWSYLLSESERFNKYMPPNELDSIWMNQQDISSEVYFGHVFLIGIQKLRALARINGFKITQLYYTRKKSTSLILFPVLYPFILLSNWITYRKNLKKNKNFDRQIVKDTYREIFKLAINPKLLVDGHIMVEFEKEMNFNEVSQSLKSIHQEFGTT